MGWEGADADIITDIISSQEKNYIHSTDIILTSNICLARIG